MTAAVVTTLRTLNCIMKVKATALLLLEVFAMGTPTGYDHSLSSNTDLLEDRFCLTRYITKKVGDGNPKQKYYHIQLSVCLCQTPSSLSSCLAKQEDLGMFSSNMSFSGTHYLRSRTRLLHLPHRDQVLHARMVDRYWRAAREQGGGGVGFLLDKRRLQRYRVLDNRGFLYVQWQCQRQGVLVAEGGIYTV